MRPMFPIPVDAAKLVADRYGYDQVIIVARRIGDAQPCGEHVTTYGVTPVHCDVAARCGNFIKRQIMHWPEIPTLSEGQIFRIINEVAKLSGRNSTELNLEKMMVSADELVGILQSR